MKKVYQLIMILAVTCVSAQTSVKPDPGWNVKFKVMDEANQPIAGAKVEAWYYVPPPPGKTEASDKLEGLTDTNGVFVASHQDHSADLAFRFEKPSYYLSRMQYHMGFDYDPAIWNSTQTIVLKKINQPIPMYAKRINAQPPDNGKPVGYDLMVGDWVAPYGKGIDTDIIFTREYNRKSLQDYDYKLTVSFPKAGDGIQEYPVLYKNMEGSALHSPHEAPTNGYQSQIVRLNVSRPGQKLIYDYDENRVYFFCVRTLLDENGKVKSALYGKIYGDFMSFDYYLNPTPNDRNMEFDPKQNMMKNLKPLEGVEAP